MNASELQEVRSSPLFAKLEDDQLSCLDGGEIIEAPAGAVIASEGERTGFFHVILSPKGERSSIRPSGKRIWTRRGESLQREALPHVQALFTVRGRLLRRQLESA